jgi:2-deoxystreptamine N-acetyl-D-glucosaminyltransferase/2-deoxystreptamine glucosyltransferase
LYAGRITRSKGVFVLADALRQVSEDVPCLRFVACGTGPDRDAFEASVRGTLGSRAVFLGPVPPARVAQAMRDARVVVLPSFGEGMSGSVIEALSVGRAVVTTDTGEHAVIVRRGAGGTVVPVGDVRALAGALVSELCRRREPGALHALVDRFTPRAVADRLLELYDLMLGGPFQRERSPVPGTRILAGPLVKGGTP